MNFPIEHSTFFLIFFSSFPWTHSWAVHATTELEVSLWTVLVAYDTNFTMWTIIAGTLIAARWIPATLTEL